MPLKSSANILPILCQYMCTISFYRSPFCKFSFRKFKVYKYDFFFTIQQCNFLSKITLLYRNLD